MACLGKSSFPDSPDSCVGFDFFCGYWRTVYLCGVLSASIYLKFMKNRNLRACTRNWQVVQLKEQTGIIVSVCILTPKISRN